MKGPFGKIEFLLIWALLPGGCVGRPEPVRLDTAGVTASADVSDLAAVLSEVVAEDGRLRPKRLAEVRQRLVAQLRKLAVSGPTATPGLYATASARRAYWYNARAAWSIRLADLAGAEFVCRGVDGRRRLPLDGRMLSLEAVDAILLADARREGGFRLAACAPGVLCRDAPLPSRPFEAGRFAADLGAALERLILDERRFVIDADTRTVRVPELLWASRDLVIGRFHDRYGGSGASLITALKPHVGPAARRRLEAGTGYAALPHGRRAKPAALGRMIFWPGKVGRIEP